VTLGTNKLIGRDLGKLRLAVKDLMRGNSISANRRYPDEHRVPLWDGHAGERLGTSHRATFGVVVVAKGKLIYSFALA
jgi:hypothetical protein